MIYSIMDLGIFFTCNKHSLQVITIINIIIVIYFNFRLNSFISCHMIQSTLLHLDLGYAAQKFWSKVRDSQPIFHLLLLLFIV